MAISRFKRVLIANRGEIAVRIIRALRELNIESVAVYSDADANSMHVRLADYAVRLPGRLSAETYLNIPALVEAIKVAQADAVHPGYGFLSENADFVDAVTGAGAKFIGPSSHAMRLMGDKIAAKNLMKKTGVAVVPGSDRPLESADEIKAIAQETGYPLILKAAAGGGGRGMRVVRTDSELEPALAACQREALAWFGNPAVFCERYIERPRHIEIQVLFDEHGNGVHLYERDCSVQRRHQKLLEEAPSPYLDNARREKLGEAAVRAAKAAGYANAGTIEFICESPDQIYFMEMNTRIQVEHPVTEAVTGVDLVRHQILVAMGETLPFSQADIKLNGWAIELRINAEDPTKSFAPAPGRVDPCILPAGPDVRVDSHLYAGFTIPSEYDSMVAKIIVKGPDRAGAITKARRALAEMQIGGVPTTAKFHEVLLCHPSFEQGDITTRFLEETHEEFQAAYIAGPENSQSTGSPSELSRDAAAILAALGSALNWSNGSGANGVAQISTQNSGVDKNITLTSPQRSRWADAAIWESRRSR